MKEDLAIVLAYIKDFWKNRRFIYRIVGLFLVLGVLNAVFSHKEFTSRTSFVAQVSGDEKLGSGLKNIAALIGVNFNEDSDAKDLPVYLYPKIIQSLDYQRELLNTRIHVNGYDSAVTLKQYYSKIRKPDLPTIIKKYTIGLPGLLVNQFKSKPAAPTQIDSVNYVSEEEMRMINLLSENVLFSIDETDGTIFLSATLPERVASAQVAERAKDLLQKKIIEYRITKARQEFDFINKQYADKKEEYQNAQSIYASYLDRNMFNTTQTSQVRKQRLETDFTRSSMVYSELETQRIRQGIKVQENTPAFMTLQPAVVPIEPINDNAIVIIIKFVAIGFIIDVLLYLILMVRTKFRAIWKTI